MKVTTKTGDQGTTFLLKRRPKNDLRVEVLGRVDELLAEFLLVGAEIPSLLPVIETIYSHLGNILAYLAMEEFVFSKDCTEYLETQNKKYGYLYEDLNQFVQASTLPACKLNLLRTKVRSLERLFITLDKEETVDSSVLIYLNRLSDYLFVQMLFANEK